LSGLWFGVHDERAEEVLDHGLAVVEFLLGVEREDQVDVLCVLGADLGVLALALLVDVGNHPENVNNNGGLLRGHYIMEDSNNADMAVLGHDFISNI